MWCLFTYKATLLLSGSKHIVNIVKPRKLTAHYWFNDKVLFRFKKSNKSGQSKNYPTRTALAFYDQQNENSQADWVGAPVRLDLTYVLNKAKTSIIDIMAVYRIGDQIIFSSSLLSDSNLEEFNTRVSSPEPDNTQQTSGAGVIKPKPGIQKQKKKNE